MSLNINEFKSRLQYGGARQALFRVQLNNPVAPLADLKAPWMIKSASLPPSNTGMIAVPFMGRILKYPGDRMFDEWTVTVINDEDFQIRNAMESWSNSINAHIANTRALPQNVKSDAVVQQLSRDDRVLRQYSFQGLFPVNISEISLGWEQQDAIEEFTVTFAYDAWTINGGITGISTT